MADPLLDHHGALSLLVGADAAQSNWTESEIASFGEALMRCIPSVIRRRCMPLWHRSAIQRHSALAMEVVCRCLHWPIARWCLSCVDGRSRAALLRPLNVDGWEQLIDPDAAQHSVHWHTDHFKRIRDRYRVFRTAGGDAWIDCPWSLVHEECPDMCDSGVVLWNLRFGSILCSAYTGTGLVLPRGTYNLPRSAANLVRFLREWRGLLTDHADDSCAVRLAEARVQQRLDALFASTSDRIRCALRLNVAQFPPAYVPFEGNAYGCPSAVAYDAAFAFVCRLACAG